MVAMKRNAVRILIVDDDREMRRLLADFLEGEGFDVVQAADAAQTLTRIREAPCDVVLLDKNLPDWSGLHILPALRKLLPRTPVIVITAFGDMRTHDDAFSRGAFDLLFKPFSLDELLVALQRACDHVHGGPARNPENSLDSPRA
jgi:DNA-binding NtrC family response regulator